MKLGIITLYYGGNYGTYFQALCLQKQILKLGHECEIISAAIRGMQPWRYYLLLCFNRFVPKHVKQILSKKLVFYSGYCTLEKETIHLKKSKICFSLRRLSKEYDGIILGSDEIWSTNSSEVRSQLVFWGKGAQCPIVSYASSGINWKIPSAHLDPVFKELYNRMLYVGVRDNTTYNTVKNYIGEERVSCVVDPTILNPFYLQEGKNSRKNVLVYGPSFPQNMIDQIITFSKEKNLSLSCMGWYHSWCDEFIEPDNGINVQKMFAESDYIVSSSYHGTIFSIMHRKQFISVEVNERGSKIRDLLKRLNLEHRITNTNIYLLETAIDYKKVFILVNRLRRESLSVLKKELEMINDVKEENRYGF